ncbi:MAG: hypothetical protein HYV68_02455 [Candidatus Taylorbacteria bacterium]|nr:hypothetical protein [Candidatus Taylorbacteria bacterium]
MKTRGSGVFQKQILTVLLAGLTMGLSRSPRKHWRIISSELPKELAKCKLHSLEYGLHRLYDNDYIGIRKDEAGYYQPYLTLKGKQYARRVSLDSISLDSPPSWDGKFRLVFFDIPERLKKGRDTLRFHLKRLGFKEVQKSIFCYPHDCAAEIMQILEELALQRFVQYAVVDEMSNAAAIKKLFDL